MRKTLFTKNIVVLSLMLLTLIPFSVNAANSSSRDVDWKTSYCNANLKCEAVLDEDVPYCVYGDGIDFVPDCVLSWVTNKVSKEKESDLTTENIIKTYCKAVL